MIVALDSAASWAHGVRYQSRSLDDLGEIVAGLLPRASHLVSDGGDGTLHWLINEVRSQVADPERWPAFVPSRAGTIDFVARKARVRRRADPIVSALAAAAKLDQSPPEYSSTLCKSTADRSTERVQRVGFALAAAASVASSSIVLRSSRSRPGHDHQNHLTHHR